MTRLLTIILICACLGLVACSKSSSSTALPTATPDDTSSTKGETDPTAMSLESPPTAGKLPADLYPPA